MAERRLALVVVLVVALAVARGVAWCCALDGSRIWRCGCLAATACCHGG